MKTQPDEFKTVYAYEGEDYPSIADILNQHSQDGWDVVTVLPAEKNGPLAEHRTPPTIIFRRSAERKVAA